MIWVIPNMENFPRQNCTNRGNNYFDENACSPKRVAVRHDKVTGGAAAALELPWTDGTALVRHLQAAMYRRSRIGALGIGIRSQSAAAPPFATNYPAAAPAHACKRPPAAAPVHARVRLPAAAPSYRGLASGMRRKWPRHGRARVGHD